MPNADNSPYAEDAMPSHRRGLTTRQAMDVINLSDEDFYAKYGCRWCGQPPDQPALNSRGEPCPCGCHK